MYNKLKALLLGIVVWCFLSPSAVAQKQEQTLHDLNTLLINTVMDDLFTPPVSSRIYVYPHIAFYECIRQQDPAYASLAGKLNGLKALPKAPPRTDLFIAACISFARMGQFLVGSEYKMEDWAKAFGDSMARTTDLEVLKISMDYGRQVADSILAWSKKDNYLVSKGMPRFTLSSKPGTWLPTPNEYAPALEPWWKILRPMAVRSAGQFSPAKKLVYSPSKQSEFYKNVYEVYQIGKTLDSLKTSIAWYWDDNPNVSVQKGHLTYFEHKISPGGHWLMITRQACLEKNIPLVKASFTYTLTAISLFDAFISCWNEKYNSNLIRPVTVIKRTIDPAWDPLIQTPPFPEFTSGHAVISNAAATVLTRILGENYQFTDNTEIPFNIKPRSFPSFYAAAEESTWSRVYGGIHYPETARISIKQGRAIGNYVLQVCQVHEK